jgi:hypothetical protein
MIVYIIIMSDIEHSRDFSAENYIEDRLNTDLSDPAKQDLIGDLCDLALKNGIAFTQERNGSYNVSKPRAAVAATEDEPDERSSESLNPEARITQDEIDAWLATVPWSAKENGLFMQNDGPPVVTRVICPISNSYVYSTPDIPVRDQIDDLEDSIAVYDDPDKLIVEYFANRFNKGMITRRILDKSTGGLLVEEKHRDEAEWSRAATSNSQEDLASLLRDSLSQLKYGAYDELHQTVKKWRFESAEFNEGRVTTPVRGGL